jgi:hypothetical protein
MLIAFILLIAGAVLKLKGHPEAWYLLGISIVLYVFARFFIRRP